MNSHQLQQGEIEALRELCQRQAAKIRQQDVDTQMQQGVIDRLTHGNQLLLMQLAETERLLVASRAEGTLLRCQLLTSAAAQVRLYPKSETGGA